MKSLLCLCAALCVVAGSAFSDTKIAYVDIDKVTGKAKQVSSALSSVGDKIKKYQSDIESKRKRKQELEEDVKRTEGVLSRDEVDKKRKEINTLNNEVDELLLLGRREMQRIDDTFYEPLMKKIIYAIQDVADEKGIDIVLRGEVVLYGKDTVDITADVIKKLNSDDSSSTATREKKVEASTKSSPEPGAAAAARNSDTGTAAPSASPTKDEPVAKPKATPKPTGTGRAVDRQPE